MKRLFAAIVLLLIWCAPVLAEDAPESGPPGIPVPSGAKFTMQMSVERDQIVAQIDAMMAMQGTDSPKLDPQALSKALGSLQRVEYAELTMTGKYSGSEIISLYEKQVTGRRVVWNIEGKPGSGTVVLATPDGGYFGAMISPTISKEGRLTAGSIKAFRMTGFIDISSAIRVVLPAMTQMGLVPKIPGIIKRK